MKDKQKKVVLPKNKPTESRNIHIWCNQATMDAFDEALRKEAAKGLWDKISKKGL